jgi:Xaa-Pro aminopeptidase
MLANLPRLQDVMKREGLDAVIATCPENVTYLSGFWAMSQWVRRGPQAYVLQPKGDIEPCIIANSGILDLVPDQDVWVKEIRRYGYFQVDVDPSAELDAADQMQRQLFSSLADKGPVEALVAALKDKGLEKAKIGLDEMGITPQCLDQLKASLPDATFVRSFALFERRSCAEPPASPKEQSTPPWRLRRKASPNATCCAPSIRSWFATMPPRWSAASVFRPAAH